MSPEQPPKFFKIIIDPKAHSLRVPIEFRRRHNANLPSTVFLRAPSGPPFEVDLIHNSKGETWLQRGWQEFKEFYSLGFGHLLVFEYDRGESYFHVLIFDVTASEIEYRPFHDRRDGVLNDLMEETIVLSDSMEETIVLSESSQDDDSDIISEEISKNKKGYYKANDHSVDISYHNTKKRKTGVRASSSVAYQMAKSFVSRKAIQNPHFISLMQPSYISNNFQLRVPVSIARDNLPDMYNRITLRVSDGKCWPVRCCIHGRTKFQARIMSGWSKFVKDNELKVGDACVFQVNMSNKFVWDVTIFRS